MDRSARTAVMALLLLGLLASPGIVGQGDEPDGDAAPEVRNGPELVLLVYHPYPDDLDPLGFHFADGLDAYMVRHDRFDTDSDGFDFPHMVVDGLTPYEGLPDPSMPQVSTLAAYRSGFDERARQDPPVTLEVSAQGTGPVDARVAVVPKGPLDGESLHLWVAVVEDHVDFAPPAPVSNGVTDHRFTVRAVVEAGAVDLAAGAPVLRNVTLDTPADAVVEQLYLVAWLQQGSADGLRFDAFEVVQATTHHVLTGGVTVQAEKGVLMELYSATWCDPCLFGDRAAEALADEYGVATIDPVGPAHAYYRPPAQLWLVLLAALAGGLWAGRAKIGGRQG